MMPYSPARTEMGRNPLLLLRVAAAQGQLAADPRWEVRSLPLGSSGLVAEAA